MIGSVCLSEHRGKFPKLIFFHFTRLAWGGGCQRVHWWQTSSIWHLLHYSLVMCLSHRLLLDLFILFPYRCCSEFITCCTRVIFHHISNFLCRTSLSAHHPILVFQFPLRQESNTGVFGGWQLREAGDLQLIQYMADMLKIPVPRPCTTMFREEEVGWWNLFAKPTHFFNYLVTNGLSVLSTQVSGTS